MSAFLGPIHYWLYNKIRLVNEREQAIFEAAAVSCGDLAEELRAQVRQTYGDPPPAGDLAGLIDTGNIHGWLQRQINLAETREAAFVRELTDICGDDARAAVREAFELHGTACGRAAAADSRQDCTNAGGIFKAMNDCFLNGMPCDQADRVVVNVPGRTVWEGVTCLQEPNWKRAGADPRFMKELYRIWLAAFARGMNPAATYTQTADTLDGDASNRHEFLIAGPC